MRICILTFIHLPFKYYQNIFVSNNGIVYTISKNFQQNHSFLQYLANVRILIKSFMHQYFFKHDELKLIHKPISNGSTIFFIHFYHLLKNIYMHN